MDPVISTQLLRSQGFDADDVLRLQRAGQLVRIRRGAYLRRYGSEDPLPEASVEQRHLLLVAATAPQLAPGAVLSHGTAAVLHGLPVWPEAVEQVHLTRSRSYGGRRRRLVQVHVAQVPAEHSTSSVHGSVTTVARTVLDLGRTLAFEQAVAAGDRALAAGITRRDLAAVLTAMRGWPGARQARRVVEFLDGRTESVGESVSRVRFADWGLPAPEPQLVLRGRRGEFVARVDFGWLEQRTVGEFDGRVKYRRRLEPGRAVEEVVYAEKLREDAIRELGWQVVRWTWADLHRPDLLRERLARAFARCR